MKKFLRQLLYSYYRLPMLIIEKCVPSLTREGMTAACRAYESVADFYVQYNIRPKRAEKVISLSREAKKLPSYAVVIQGPLDAENNFTLETARTYRKIFPKGILIISTWNDQDRGLLGLLKNEGAVVVTDDPPVIRGRGNVNCQLKSTLNGVRKAEELGAEYVFKTRSDQRIYKNNVFEYLYNLLNYFPAGAQSGQKKRMVFLQGSRGCMFMPYYLADFFCFGTTEDMKHYYRTAEDSEPRKTSAFEKDMTVWRYILENSPQCYINRRYFGKNSEKDNRVSDYWECIKQSVLSISWDDIELYWHKYNERYLKHVMSQTYLAGDDDHKLLTYNWTFSNWLNVYSGTFEYEKEFEQIKNRPL